MAGHVYLSWVASSTMLPYMAGDAL